MGKGLWEQAFVNMTSETGALPLSSVDLNGGNAGVGQLSSNSIPTTAHDSEEVSGGWERTFYRKTEHSAGSSETPAAEAAERPSSTGPQSPPPSRERPSSQPFHTAPVYRKRNIKDAPILSELGAYLDKIWINIHLERVEDPPKTFLFCGATRGSGATFISLHLSLSLALERNMKVLYVDANLDNPEQRTIFPNMQKYAGLASYLAGYRTIESLILKTQFRNLYVLPSGACEILSQPSAGPQNPRTIEEFVAYCKAHYDATIFDAEPVVEYPSTTAFAREVDRAVIVCKYGYSRREVSRLAIDKLKENGVFVAGVILNEREYPLPESVYATVK